MTVPLSVDQYGNRAEAGSGRFFSRCRLERWPYFLRKPDIVLITERNVFRTAERSSLQEVSTPPQSLVVHDQLHRKRRRLRESRLMISIVASFGRVIANNELRWQACLLRQALQLPRSRNFSPLYVAIAIDITTQSNSVCRPQDADNTVISADGAGPAAGSTLPGDRAPGRSCGAAASRRQSSQ